MLHALGSRRQVQTGTRRPVQATNQLVILNGFSCSSKAWDVELMSDDEIDVVDNIADEASPAGCKTKGDELLQKHLAVAVRLETQCCAATCPRTGGAKSA